MQNAPKPGLKRYFLDTEFHDPKDGGFGVDFISLGLVADNGKQFYGVYDGVNVEKLGKDNEWLRKNVLSRLPYNDEWWSLDEIKQKILDLIEPARNIEIWTSNGSYDNFILCRIFGGMGELRRILKEEKGIDRVVFRDMNELRRQYGPPQCAPQSEYTKHISIEDAKQDKREFDWYYQNRIKPTAKSGPAPQ